MASGVCRLHTGLLRSHDMKLNQLTKAAKRFSADAPMPLNEAQEKLATYFGFRNFDAAQKALRDRPADPPGFYWMDLDKLRFRILCNGLLDRLEPSEVTGGARRLATALLDYFRYEKSLSTEDFERRMGYQSLLSTWENGDIQRIGGHMTPRYRGIANYLEIELKKLGHLPHEQRAALGRPIRSDLHLEHLAILMPGLIKMLKTIQGSGGCGSLYIRPLNTSLRALLDRCGEERRSLTQQESEAMVLAIHEAEIFIEMEEDPSTSDPTKIRCLEVARILEEDVVVYFDKSKTTPTREAILETLNLDRMLTLYDGDGTRKNSMFFYGYLKHIPEARSRLLREATSPEKITFGQQSLEAHSATVHEALPRILERLLPSIGDGCQQDTSEVEAWIARGS